MDGWLVAILVVVGVVVLLVLLHRFGLIDIADQRRGTGAGAFAGVDEVFFPTRAEASQELAREAVLPAPAPIPGDGDLGVFSGRVMIELDGSTADGPTAAGPTAAGPTAAGARLDAVDGGERAAG